MNMNLYTWAVVKECRLVGYIKALSEREALRMAEKQYGYNLFVERVNLHQPVTDK